ncbi:MAG: hydrogenase iron-sulfur subunit [Desulfovibrionales bacterium]|nr:hydrogenase iron-sulfur subunit [Desulfovibrionales bacterium]
MEKFENLKKWEGTLASCIRCGYCYENCPLFKHTGWESDAPRAKIITAFGLLSGQVEPNEASASKLFNCFYCKRCEAACSSGVKLTEVFTDAKKDLVNMGLKGPGTTSITQMNCASCLACVRACPHDARTHEESGIVVDPVKCKSCGICVEVCPAGAAVIVNNFGTSKPELNEGVTQFLDTHENAKAIVYACNWSYYPELKNSRLPDAEADDKEYKIFVNMCAGRLEAQTIMEPFLHKAWGVLVACCPDGECENDGNVRAKKNIANLKSTLEAIDIDPERVHVVEIPAGDSALFQAEIDTFIEKMNQMGPIR